VAIHKNHFRRTLVNWYRKNGRDLPWRRTRDPYAILVSEFMLQQTQVATVFPYYNEWLRRFPNFDSLARASQSNVLHAWQGLGYYARARNLHGSAKIIARDHDGSFPRDIAQMRKLPGIGRYTANAVATFAFDQSVPVVEANIARVLARLFDMHRSIDSSIGAETIWRYAAELLPKRRAALHNSALMDLGALICTARAPKCRSCPVQKLCRAKNPISLPKKRSQPKIDIRTEHHSFTFRHDRILLEKSRTRWRGMWILPPLLSSKLDCFKQSSLRRRPVYVREFPFTHHRITLAVFPGAQRSEKKDQRWFSRRALESIPLPSPHRRAIVDLLAEHR
jgi:A/G-specific adenine glycosylase